MFAYGIEGKSVAWDEAPMTDDTDAKARATDHGLIQGYIGPDHKVLDMAAFYSTLVQALKEARQE
jgi:hypothetical protein